MLGPRQFWAEQQMNLADNKIRSAMKSDRNASDAKVWASNARALGRKTNWCSAT